MDVERIKRLTVNTELDISKFRLEQLKIVVYFLMKSF